MGSLKVLIIHVLLVISCRVPGPLRESRLSLMPGLMQSGTREGWASAHASPDSCLWTFSLDCLFRLRTSGLYRNPLLKFLFADSVICSSDELCFFDRLLLALVRNKASRQPSELSTVGFAVTLGSPPESFEHVLFCFILLCFTGTLAQSLFMGLWPQFRIYFSWVRGSCRDTYGLKNYYHGQGQQNQRLFPQQHCQTFWRWKRYYMKAFKKRSSISFLLSDLHIPALPLPDAAIGSKDPVNLNVLQTQAGPQTQWIRLHVVQGTSVWEPWGVTLAPTCSHGTR